MGKLTESKGFMPGFLHPFGWGINRVFYFFKKMKGVILIFLAMVLFPLGAKEETRIVSLAPSITEIIYALELDKELVGVTNYCNYPKEAKAKPKVGEMKGTSLEMILKLAPTVVIGTKDGNDIELLNKLSELGLELITYEPRDLIELEKCILDIGKRFDREAQALRLVSECERKRKMVEEKVKGKKKPKVIIVFSEKPLILAGAGTFANDLIRRAGGLNVAESSRIPYPEYSIEQVLSTAVEVIIDASMMVADLNSQKKVERFWSNWKSLPAVKNHKVYVVDPDLITRPGPRMFDGLLELATKIHPEAFENR